MAELLSAVALENRQWARRVERAEEVMGERPAFWAQFAVRRAIDDERKKLGRAHIFKDPERIARAVRHYELAYFRLGGEDSAYWPAVYR